MLEDLFGNNFFNISYAALSENLVDRLTSNLFRL